VQVVDMRQEGERARGTALFSRLLLHCLGETLSRREQAILFLNRRGFVPVLYCPGCRSTVACGHCSTALTYHRRIARAVCHTCCKERDVPSVCPTCSRPALRHLGGGSERVAHELARHLAGARVARMDSDSMRRREDYERTLGAFERHELDVLVGTQMIAKGLDVPRVTLVGILSADQALNLPDFRSEERTFQLIAQVSGRAGRGRLPGRVVVQTTAPESPAIRLGARGDYAAMAAHLEQGRRAFGYPPFARLVRVVVEDKDPERGKTAAERLAAGLRARFHGDGFSIEGPGPAPLALVRGKHRQHLLVKAPPSDPRFGEALAWLVDEAERESRSAVKVDVDPAGMM
jgi:primosomal protein N' (replication factor Y)